MKIKVMVKDKEAKRSKCVSEREYDNDISEYYLAKEFAERLAKHDCYSMVKIIELPDKRENKPYSKKEIIYKNI